MAWHVLVFLTAVSGGMPNYVEDIFGDVAVFSPPLLEGFDRQYHLCANHSLIPAPHAIIFGICIDEHIWPRAWQYPGPRKLGHPMQMLLVRKWLARCCSSPSSVGWSVLVRRRDRELRLLVKTLNHSVSTAALHVIMHRRPQARR